MWLSPRSCADEEVHGQMTAEGILEVMKKLAPTASEN
ncbi:hypothetical protein N752_04335 [Desulforamulus aquiferis]|nr:hypothetical protein N752_04335 [Desulforamulus aquiferis]